MTILRSLSGISLKSCLSLEGAAVWLSIQGTYEIYLENQKLFFLSFFPLQFSCYDFLNGFDNTLLLGQRERIMCWECDFSWLNQKWPAFQLSRMYFSEDITFKTFYQFYIYNWFYWKLKLWNMKNIIIFKNWLNN